MNPIEKTSKMVSAFMQGPSHLKWITDINDNLVFANQAFLDFFCLGSETLPRNVYEVFPPETADLFSKTNQLVRLHRQPQDTNLETEIRDGSKKLLQTHSFIINGTVNPALVATEATDITEKMKRTGKTELEKERLIYLNRTTSEAIWEWDIVKGEVYRNKQLQELTGFTHHTATDLSWWFNRIHADDRERVQHSVADTLENKRISWEEEYQFQCADGFYKVVHDRGFVVYENNHPVKMIGSLQDVSELARLRNQLAEEKLMYQKEIAESIIAAQERERTNLGNELHDNVNQILTTAKLYLEMMQPESDQEKDIREKTKELISMAYDEIRKLSKELVSPELKSESIINVIQELLNDIKSSGRFIIHFRHDPAIWVSRNMKTTLFRIAQEQLKNIVRYSAATEINLSLQAEMNGIHLIISDNGKGFDPKASRTGIGLVNIEERVKLYNGTVNLDTAPGAGCRLSVFLPV